MRALPTTYAGYRFRSRVEARWAVFFDTLGLDWEFEPEGFATGVGNYLPDFKVLYPGQDASEAQHHWFEVKGSLRDVTDAEWVKMLAFQHNEGLIVLDGPPARKMYCSPSELLRHCGDGLYDEVATVLAPPTLNIPHAESRCRGGWALWSSKGRLWWDEHENYWGNDCYYDDIGIIEAIAAARGARFGT